MQNKIKLENLKCAKKTSREKFATRNFVSRHFFSLSSISFFSGRKGAARAHALNNLYDQLFERDFSGKSDAAAAAAAACNDRKVR